MQPGNTEFRRGFDAWESARECQAYARSVGLLLYWWADVPTWYRITSADGELRWYVSPAWNAWEIHGQEYVGTTPALDGPGGDEWGLFDFVAACAEAIKRGVSNVENVSETGNRAGRVRASNRYSDS